MTKRRLSIAMIAAIVVAVVAFARWARSTVYTETDVLAFRVCLNRNYGSPHADADFFTVDAGGTHVQRVEMDLYPLLSGGQQTTLKAVYTTLRQLAYSTRSLPTPTPEP